jgi:tripartite-type tricarboxylate transporter receptor subunit TctC
MRVISLRTVAAAALVALPALLATSAPAAGESIEDHFRGKQIRLLIGSSAGGGYDAFARTIARYWGNHIPGHPAFVPQNMTGFMSLPVAHYLYNTAPADGTVVGAVNPQIASEAVLDPGRAQFDARRFGWIGSALREDQMVIDWHTAPVTKFDDLFTQQLIVGGSGGADSSYVLLVNAILGTKFKLIGGYPGTREINLAMQRGEVQGNGGITWASIKTTLRDLLDSKQINLVAQYGIHPNPELPDVPRVISYARNPADRAALSLVFDTQEFGRPFILPPGTPAPIVDAMRTSFAAVMRDPAFRAEAAQRGLDIDPTPGEEIDALVADIYAAPPDIVARVAAILEQPTK